MSNTDKILYPEHMKLKANNHKTEIIHDFLEWVQQEFKAELYTDDGTRDGKLPLIYAIRHDALLAKYIDVDMDVIEQEKRDMLDQQRAMNREADAKKASSATPS